MIHYTCDRCRRAIDTRTEVRYSVRIEITAAAGDESEYIDEDEDGDNLDQINEIIAELETGPDPGDFRQSQFGRRKFDLCSSCHDRFIRDPMGSESEAEVGFSDN